jgi:hypothetical protein
MSVEVVAVAATWQEVGERCERLFPQLGWYRLGLGGSSLVRDLISDLVSTGWSPVGNGKVPEGHVVVYAPTGTVNRGGRGQRMRWYVGRWSHPLGEGS